ncbi:MAG: ACP S-malonyltransferase, partial [Bacillota bacterium]
EFSIAEEVFAAANQALDFDVAKLCFEGPEDKLVETEITQPAIVTMSIAVNEVLKEEGIEADMVAGHSLGEYSALVAAGALDFKTAVQLVHKRGKFMEEAVPAGKGSMAAIIGLERAALEDVVAEGNDRFGVVELANYNTPIQTVISGESEAVEKTAQLAEEVGAKRAIMLDVSGPFHSSLMEPASQKLSAELKQADITTPQLPILANVTGDYVESPSEIREALIKQLSGSVYWVDTIERMIDDGVTTFIEVGPGRTLKGFMRYIDRSVTALNVQDISSLKKTLQKL